MASFIVTVLKQREITFKIPILVQLIVLILTLLQGDSITKYGEADNVEHLVGSMKKMLKPRVVGTQNHEEIKQFIIK